MSVVASSTRAAGRLPRVKLRRLRPATFSGFRGIRATPVRAATTLATALATTVASAALLSGCQVMSPIQTTVPYQAADGVASEVSVPVLLPDDIYANITPAPNHFPVGPSPLITVGP